LARIWIRGIPGELFWILTPLQEIVNILYQAKKIAGKSGPPPGRCATGPGKGERRREQGI